MAFSPDQKVSISRILGIPLSLLDAHLTSVGAAHVTAVQSQVEAELERWETSGGSFVKLHPRESNKGVETFPDADKADIRRNIAVLLEYMTASAGMRSMGTLQIG
jgi:hypothetical protein